MDVLDRADLPFPHSLPEFQRLFPDDAACAAYLEKARWGDGFACPHCGTAGEPFHFENRPGVLRCRKCRQNTGLTVGTVMERSHTPLNVWFWAAYLVASQTPGMSAVQFQRQLGLSRYETAFQILHKLRSGMVRPNQDRIGGQPKNHVEVDETWVGGRTRGEGRGVHHKVPVSCAIEVRHRKPGTKLDNRKDGRYAGRVRLAVVLDRSAESLCGFVESTVAPGSLIVTDDWSGYAGLGKRGYEHFYGTSFWARFLFEHCACFRPLHRVAAWMSGQGLPISPGTLANSLKRFVPLFEPVADAILAHQNEAALRHADETGWRVQALRGEDRSSRAWLWTSVSSDAVSFHIDPSRSAEAALELFGEALLDTVIVCDRYSAYKRLARLREGLVTLAFCWSHQRRDFIECAAGQVIHSERRATSTSFPSPAARPPLSWRSFATSAPSRSRTTDCASIPKTSLRNRSARTAPMALFGSAPRPNSAPPSSRSKSMSVSETP